MAKPYFYINVHQTIGIVLVAGCVAAYIFNYKGVRTDLNDVMSKARG